MSQSEASEKLSAAIGEWLSAHSPAWYQTWADSFQYANTISALVILVAVVYLSQLITKQILLRGIRKLLARTELGSDPNIGIGVVIGRFAQVVPALFLSVGIYMVPQLSDTLTTIISNVCNAYVALTVARAISAALNAANEIYIRRPDAQDRPIKGYLQVGKIIIYVVAAILVIASLIDRSPVILLSGLGAMGAVIMLLFQDTILSFVASVQVSSNDMVRVGDWIEMPKYGADGDVIDIALHTIRVQNWDKTITTIPTKVMISESFKNYRGMQESGGRRIKRALYLDQNSIDFLTDDAKQALQKFSLLKDYLADKQQDIDDWNQKLQDRGEDPINSRQITNIGTFRAYVKAYLRHHQYIHQHMTQLVRQLEPSPQGLPLEVYCFTNTTKWAEFEAIQSDIFDHLLAILPQFGLRVYQQPSGRDLTELGRLFGHH